MFIKDSISNLSQYCYINTGLNIVVDFLKQNDIGSYTAGNYEIGQNCRLNILEYQTTDHADLVFEKHVKYLDLHYLFLGEEKVYICERAGRLKKAYDPKVDYALYECNDYQGIILGQSEFLLMDTGVYHKPSMICGRTKTVKKAVFKILVESINR